MVNSLVPFSCLHLHYTYPPNFTSRDSFLFFPFFNQKLSVSFENLEHFPAFATQLFPWFCKVLCLFCFVFLYMFFRSLCFRRWKFWNISFKRAAWFSVFYSQCSPSNHRGEKQFYKYLSCMWINEWENEWINECLASLPLPCCSIREKLDLNLKFLDWKPSSEGDFSSLRPRFLICKMEIRFLLYSYYRIVFETQISVMYMGKTSLFTAELNKNYYN